LKASEIEPAIRMSEADRQARWCGVPISDLSREELEGAFVQTLTDLRRALLGRPREAGLRDALEVVKREYS